MSVHLDKTGASLLAARIEQIVPGARIVRLTAVATHHGPRTGRHYVAMVLDDQRRALPIPPGGARRLAAVLQAAYPAACWSGSQCWTTRTGALTPLKTAASTRPYGLGVTC